MPITYATWNTFDKGSALSLSNGNLTLTKTTANEWKSVRSTISVSSGKWYWEISFTTLTSGDSNSGIAKATENVNSFVGDGPNGWGYYGNNGNLTNNGANTPYGATFNGTNVVGYALDMDAGMMTFYKNNVSQGVATSGLSGQFFAEGSLFHINDQFTVNFGATALTYSPPAGFNAGLYSGSLSPPVADFSGTPLSGTASLDVQFTDLSTNTPTSWLWDFGDGHTDTTQNPLHTYSTAGTYTVSLTATNADGSNQKTQTDYITVNAPTPPASTGGTGGSLWARGGRRKLRRRPLTESEFAELQERMQAIAAQSVPIIPMDAVPETFEDDTEEEDMLIQAALIKILH